MLVWLGVYMGEHTLFFFLLLVWVGVYVGEQAILPSIGLFAFFFLFFSFFGGGSGLGVYVGEHALLSFVCRRAYNLRSVLD